jgi:hydroxymethylglutaryl-CoA reductase (NADPH)
LGERRNSIKDFLYRLKSFKKPLEEIDKLIDNENLAALLRRKLLEEKLDISLSATGSSILDFTEIKDKVSYKPIGAIQVPVTVIGPLRIEGLIIRGEKYIPLASIYPALMEAVDLGSKTLEDSHIRIKPGRIWLRIFTISPREKPVDLCKLIEDRIISKGIENLRILCYGRGAGHIINTVIIGEYGMGKQLLSLIESGEIQKILLETIGSGIPIITPYLVFDSIVSSEINKGKLNDLGVKPGLFIEAYNAIEDLKPIDNSLLPVILGVLTSFYLSIGIKPEYALRSDIKQFSLINRFRKIILRIESRLILPLMISIDETTIMNREVLSILKLERIRPETIAEIGHALMFTSYTGLIASIAKSAS